MGVLAVTLFADISPKVEGDFFFAEDDPQVRASRDVAERFPAGSQIILRVADLGDDDAAHRGRIAALTRDLLAVDGVDGGYSVTTDDPTVSPLFGRILLTPDPRATNVVLLTDETDPELLLPRIEEAVERHVSPDMEVIVSGVPAIVEMIRRSLYRDLVVFSSAAVVVFALLIGIVFRDAAVVAGTMSTCAVAVAATLLIVQAMGVPIGLLTANLITIVFVLTLSHVVFLTANWSRAAAGSLERSAALRGGITQTIEGSLWSMTTTLLGFLSLLIATARPLRELGVAGAVGTVTALVVAYAVYPAFLGRWARSPAPGVGPGAPSVVRGGPGGRGLVAAAGLVVVVSGTGIARLDTDPSLLSYFGPDSEIRRGLERIDADGGTSTLDIVVRGDDGQTVDARPVFAAMEALQERLEDDPAVGVVLSPTVLIGHARTIPLAGFLPIGMLLDIASSEQLGGVGLGFVTPDREQARFSLRMREAGRPARDDVMLRMRGLVDESGLETVAVAGLYDLQAQLGRLIMSSLAIGIGGLLLLFFGVAVAVSGSVRTAAGMWVCLVAIPLVVLGLFGHAICPRSLEVM